MSKRAIQIAGRLVQSTDHLSRTQRAILGTLIDIPLLVGAYLLASWQGVLVAVVAPPYIHIREALTR